MKTRISQKTRPRNSAGNPGRGTGELGGARLGPRSTAPPPRDRGTAARRRTAGRRSRPDSTARRTAAGHRRSGPCPTRTASASPWSSCSGPGTALAIIMPAPITIATIRNKKDRREFRAHRSTLLPIPASTRITFVNGFTKSVQKKSRLSPGSRRTRIRGRPGSGRRDQDILARGLAGRIGFSPRGDHRNGPRSAYCKVEEAASTS